MYEPKIFGLHIFCSISLWLRELVMVHSSFCSISPCPTAATHTSVSNYLGQQHQNCTNRNHFKEDKKPQSHKGQHSADGQDVDKCNESAEETEGRKIAFSKQARGPANIIRASKQHKMCNLRCSISWESSALSVILSAQLRASHCDTDWKRN